MSTCYLTMDLYVHICLFLINMSWLLERKIKSDVVARICCLFVLFWKLNWIFSWSPCILFHSPRKKRIVLETTYLINKCVLNERQCNFNNPVCLLMLLTKCHLPASQPAQRGKREPTLFTIFTICTILKCSIAENHPPTKKKKKKRKFTVYRDVLAWNAEGNNDFGKKYLVCLFTNNKHFYLNIEKIHQ